jgi:hypothetical protein
MAPDISATESPPGESFGRMKPTAVARNRKIYLTSRSPDQENHRNSEPAAG